MKPSEFTTLGNVREYLGDLTSLLHSIAFKGVLVPLRFYKAKGENVVWDGHRRLRCALINNRIFRLKREEQGIDSAGILARLQEEGALIGATLKVNELDLLGHTLIEDIPAILFEPPEGTVWASEFQLIAGSDSLSKPLTPLEEAKALKAMLEHRTPKYLAMLIGKSESYVSRRWRLADLHPDFQEAIQRGKLGAKAAEEILNLADDSNPGLRRSILAARTVKGVKAKVQAANAAAEAALQPALDMAEGMDGIDPLQAVLEEEFKTEMVKALDALQAARETVRRLGREYEVVPITGLKSLELATRWLKEVADGE